MLNLEGRPSRLPDNSREPTIVLEGWVGAAKQHHGSIVSPFAVSKSKCPPRTWCGNLLSFPPSVPQLLITLKIISQKYLA